MFSKIKSIRAREIFDSRGNPTVEAILETEGGVFKASVPSGASKGKYEAKEIRDEDGKGVKIAIRNIENIIAPKLKGESVSNQKRIDNILIELDGTRDKSNLGVNAILPVSMAVCRAGAVASRLSLYKYIPKIFNSSFNSSAPSSLPKGFQVSSFNIPRGCFNILNGGAHAKNDLDIQEFMIVPQSTSFKEDFEKATDIYQELSKIIEKKYGKDSLNLGDEGGFAPPLTKTKQALDLLIEAIKCRSAAIPPSAGLFNRVKIGLDCAASLFFKRGIYRIDDRNFTKEELLNYYKDLIEEYPILFLEDPFDQDDWEGWEKLNSKFKIKNEKLLITGDDLTTTNTERIRKAHQEKACNAVIIKPNQAGTISETLEAIKLAKKFNWKIIVSHRSGETEDDFIADLAVGTGADFLKAGAPATIERLVKYNRLLAIEEELLHRPDR